MISICPGVFEELAFRGVIQGRLEEIMRRKDALILQAALFSVMHLLPSAYVSHFLIGLGLGFLRMRCRSLYPAMIVHALWNAVTVLQDTG